MYGWGRDPDESFRGRVATTAPMASAAAPTAAPAAPALAQQQGQWGQEETKELIRIRADLERDSAAAAPASGGKRSKALWESVSAEMLARGYARTPDQCKCKWKNLLNRYKGKETSDPANGRQCPFFEELHALFTQRSKNMQRLLLESEAGSPKSKRKPKKRPISDESSEGSEEEAPARSKRKAEGEKSSARADTSGTDVREALEEFFRQQMRMEKEWMEMVERRARERLLLEQDWRSSMERVERERLEAERAWREREEQRRAREESRAERRDALLTTLLNSLIEDSNV